MGNKRGISPIIATVLLLGFTIALATTVFLWMSGQTKTLSESTVEYAEGEMQCQNVRINVLKHDGSTCKTLDVSNKGYITIKQLAIRTFVGNTPSILYPESSEMKLKPQSSNCGPGTVEPNCGVVNIDPKNTTACEKTEVTPIITVGNRKVGCKDKTIVIKC